ncbi:M16 family metallopeptidase [Ruania halotolerans]|uniref:M16 family metallopeptidase n=1 Tax=Ruania halotolerans TaxID=2897773 RepID=UPI001E44159C|nr:pitrilysin family protein [Ruania halotolerans]UFU05176.1 insulinase family protein [Ruania halotolerans]
MPELTVETDAGALVRRSVLPGGIRVLTEAMPGQRSVTVGAWVAVGSRDETDGHHGSTHFLEHLLFKGTPSRDAMAIASAFDAVGGEANAATGKEHTCYFARVLDADLPMAGEVILDMVTSATLDPEEFDAEREVILEEIAMNEDDPGDVAHERFATQVFGSHALGRPIGGTPETIRAVPRDAVYEHYRRTYRPSELVVTAAGNVDHDALCAQVLDGVRTGGWPLDAQAAPAPRRQVVDSTAGAGFATGPSTRVLHRTTEQANVLLGGLGLPAGDDRRFVLAVLNAILGGSMSSRLFQEIREKRGLAYAVFSFSSGFADAGMFGLYAGCAPNKVEQVLELLADQWLLLATNPVEIDELQRGIGQVCGQLVLGLEDTGSRMSRLGRTEISTGELLTVTETLDRVRAVTPEQIRDLAAELHAQPRHLTVVGPFTEHAADGAARFEKGVPHA